MEQKGGWQEVRLIDADALMKRAEKLENEPWNKEVAPYNWAQAYVTLQEELENAPTVDAVPVVRCKDCKYYNTSCCADGFGWCERNGSGHGSTDDWFCADGEKRE